MRICNIVDKSPTSQSPQASQASGTLDALILLSYDLIANHAPFSFVDPQGGDGSAQSEQTDQLEYSEQAEQVDQIVWGQCNANCGGRCVLQWHVRGGKIHALETDNTACDVHGSSMQARACLRGRTMRAWINSPDRLHYPMKRVGARGEGKFERISWDKAIQIIADKIRAVIDTYGNDALYIHHGSGVYSATGCSVERLLNCVGGYLSTYGDYSTGMQQYVMPFMYGSGVSPYENISASSIDQMAHADLVLQFGNSPAETRMGGANVIGDYVRAREKGPEIIHIDYRYNETMAGYPSEWLPIRTGTDAALVAGIAHELIRNDWVDLDFLHTYCQGYDEQTMPLSAKGQHKSYYDYIMGLGYDEVEKTPEWASVITTIPAAKIRELAARIHKAQNVFVSQGWGLQRHSNGESATRAICMLALLTGNLGRLGTNSGLREAEPSEVLVRNLPAFDAYGDGVPRNSVRAQISCYSWLDVIEKGSDFLGERDAEDEIALSAAGIFQAPEAPRHGIKLLWNYAGNTLTNQHADINKVHQILSDETKCEFIIGCDTVFTDSAKYCDLLLPDAMRAEQLSMSTNGYSEYYAGVVVGGPAQNPPFECRPSYDVHADIAEKLGVRELFTAGKTQDEWIRELYEEGAADHPDMPSWDEIRAQGIYKKPIASAIAFEQNVKDPIHHPWNTPSGKIEIYSEALEHLAKTRVLAPGQVIAPIPLFDPGVHGYGSITKEYPLYMSGWHDKARVHSSFGFLTTLSNRNRHRLWINPLDAKPRGIADGDRVYVKSPAGEVEIEAHVTNRIVPSVVAMPQGGWHNADMTSVRKLDTGACINTLTSHTPSPLAHGNGSANSIIVEVVKA